MSIEIESDIPLPIVSGNVSGNVREFLIAVRSLKPGESFSSPSGHKYSGLLAHATVLLERKFTCRKDKATGNHRVWRTE